jgi:hypothetical protein
VSSHSSASAIWETLTRRRRHSADVQAYQGRLQVIIDDMGVDHRRAQVRMPERLLDQANIFRLPIELGRKGMPAHVWVHILVPQPGFLPSPLHHGVPRGAIDRCAFPRRKEEAAWARGAARPPAAQFLQEGFIEPEDAVFLAFPLADGELAAAPVDIVDRQRQHLSGAQAGMEHELHETAIAVPGQISRVRALQQRGHLGTGQDGGQAARTGHGTLLAAAAVLWLKVAFVNICATDTHTGPGYAPRAPETRDKRYAYTYPSVSHWCATLPSRSPGDRQRLPAWDRDPMLPSTSAWLARP